MRTYLSNCSFIHITSDHNGDNLSRNVSNKCVVRDDLKFFQMIAHFSRFAIYKINILFVATLENRFLWLFHQAIYFQNEKQKNIFFL